MWREHPPSWGELGSGLHRACGVQGASLFRVLEEGRRGHWAGRVEAARGTWGSTGVHLLGTFISGCLPECLWEQCAEAGLTGSEDICVLNYNL